MTRPSERTELRMAVLLTPQGDVVEIGSAGGKTTLVLIGAARNVGKHVYSVDPYPEELEGKATSYSPGICSANKAKVKECVLDAEFPNVTQFNCDLSECIDKLPKKLSVVFIDGLHEYDNAKAELELIYPLVVKGGRVYFHDTSWEKGQVSGTRDGGVCNIKTAMREMFDWEEVVEFPNMTLGVK